MPVLEYLVLCPFDVKSYPVDTCTAQVKAWGGSLGQFEISKICLQVPKKQPRQPLLSLLMPLSERGAGKVAQPLREQT